VRRVSPSRETGQAFFRRLIKLQNEIEVAYPRMLSVSVDPPEIAAAFRAGIGARWTFRADPDRSVQAKLGLRETTDPVHDGHASATDAHQQGAVPRDRHLSRKKVTPTDALALAGLSHATRAGGCGVLRCPAERERRDSNPRPPA
jgi:hypothetical protein